MNLQESFPPLAGEKIRAKPQFLCRKINVKKFAKTELNSPAPAGENLLQIFKICVKI